MHNTLTINAGQIVEFIEPGDFFRLMASTAPVTVEYYRRGAKVADGVNVQAGYAERFLGEGFDKLTITSGTAQSITFATRLGNEVWYDVPPVGQVQVTNTPTVNVGNTAGAFLQVQQTVTNAAGWLLASKANRRYLLIQNKGAGDIYVTLNGTPATVALGILIEAGGSLELQGYVPTAGISAIGSIASNPSVIVVEG